MKIFITGASGFVGGAATRRLVEAGHAVRAMSRSPASDERLQALGAEVGMGVAWRCSAGGCSCGHSRALSRIKCNTR